MRHRFGSSGAEPENERALAIGFDCTSLLKEVDRGPVAASDEKLVYRAVFVRGPNLPPRTMRKAEDVEPLIHDRSDVVAPVTVLADETGGVTEVED